MFSRISLLTFLCFAFCASCIAQEDRSTYRFRYDADSRKFILIGFDFADSDRLTAKVVSESTNYLTGARKVSRGKGDTSSTFPRKKIFIEDVDNEKFEEDASKRLNL